MAYQRTSAETITFTRHEQAVTPLSFLRSLRGDEKRILKTDQSYKESEQMLKIVGGILTALAPMLASYLI